jgi:hypothetical protein
MESYGMTTSGNGELSESDADAEDEELRRLSRRRRRRRQEQVRGARPPATPPDAADQPDRTGR